MCSSDLDVFGVDLPVCPVQNRVPQLLLLFDQFVVVAPASQPVSDQDLKVMSTAVDAGRAIVLVFNKWDAMDEFDKQRLERLWNTEFDRVMWAERVNLYSK